MNLVLVSWQYNNILMRIHLDYAKTNKFFLQLYHRYSTIRTIELFIFTASLSFLQKKELLLQKHLSSFQTKKLILKFF